VEKKHALIFVTITLFIDTVGFGLIMPVLPDFLEELTGRSLSANSAIAGYLVVCFAVLQFLFAPLIGNLSDRFGRKPVLLVSLFTLGINYLISGLATTLWVLFLGRILTGISSATYSTANALIADVSPPEERAQNFGLTGMAFGLGFIFGPAIGGFLGEWDTRAPFFAAAVLAFLNALYGFIVLKETLPDSLRRPFEIARALPHKALTQITKFPMLIGLIVVMFIYNIGHHVYPSNWHFYTMEKFAWTPFDIGLSMGLVGILMAFVQGYLIRVVIPKIGAPRTALIGLAAGATTYVGIAFAPTPFALYMWMFLSAVAGFVGPAVNGIMSTNVPQNQQGELQGVLASVSSIGAIIGPLLITQTFTFFTSDLSPVYFPGAAFLVAGILSLGAVAIFARNVRNLVIPPAAGKATPEN
jgi:DHA1 family tetracycline resistance protein-like MFS transporter